MEASTASRSAPALTTPVSLGLLLLVLTGLTAYRLLVLLGLDLGLYGDEAYYYTWSREPDWGYYSKPPMVAWLIQATTAVVGDTALGVKAGSLLLYPATSLVVFALANRLYGPVAGLLAGVAFATLPGVSFGSMVINTDVPLLFFWALGLWFFLRALETDAHRNWLGAGAALGLGLLSKYTMAAFAGSAFLYLLAVPGLRGRLARPGPYLALGAGLLLFLPNLLWNARHGFISFVHTGEISRLDAPLFHPEELAAFVGGQFGVFGPVLLGVLVALVAGRGGGYRREPERMLLAFAVPLLAAIALQAFLAKANANWAAPAYLSATVLVVGWLVRGQHRRLLAAGLAVNLALGGVLYHYQDAARAMGVEEVPEPLDPRARIRGWDELATAVEGARQRHPEARLLADNRFVLAELLFHLRPRPEGYGYWNPRGPIKDHYALTADIRGRRGEDFLLVTEDERAGERLAPYFEETGPAGLAHVRRSAEEREGYYFWILQGFRGYEAGS
ncbi:MAG: glycosyltransferase family 39 protein [Thiohalorhabdus sp.]|uniref:glycosyltransferase family 39 protein n=1 Tax=Thiohalorhabdus sp. TaxID=3094134 RepID=UPI003980CB1E